MSDGNYDNDVGDDDCNVLRAPEVVLQIKGLRNLSQK